MATEVHCKASEESKFLHSILSFSGRVQCFMVCSAPPARQGQLLVRRPLQTARKQKRDPSLDHRWIPIFVCVLSKTMLYWSRSPRTARGVATNVGGSRSFPVRFVLVFHHERREDGFFPESIPSRAYLYAKEVVSDVFRRDFDVGGCDPHAVGSGHWRDLSDYPRYLPRQRFG